jgi:beta-ureidopropionase
MPTEPQNHLSRRRLLQAGAVSALAAASTTATATDESDSPRRRPGRQIWVASLTLEGIQASTRDEALKQILGRMEQVSGARPDLVCLPEVFNSRLTPRPTSAQAAEPLDGPTISAMAKFAQAKRCYVVAPITREYEGKLFNTAVLLDRSGAVAGMYDKIHPTEPEMKGGITPGRTAAVFDTDFGKLGVQICFDLNWSDGWQALKDGGAELVVWPSAYPGGFPLRAIAWTHGYPIVTSTWTSPSALLDVDGHMLAQSGTWEPWISVPFCLDRDLFHLDFHQQKVRDIEKAYGRDVTVRWCHDENAFVLENRIPGRTLADLTAEFGLLPLDAYIARATKAQAQARG